MATLRPRLSEILIDSVAHGASVGFLAPLSSADADAFWSRVERSVAQKRCIVLAAALDAVIVGTVQLDVDTMPNQPHRAEVHKLLVHSAARGKGIGEALMLAAEHAALGAGRWLLTLDTATDAAARLYQRLGWKQAGAIPDYAMNPDGSLTATTFYWKKLGREA
jgi:ribosomal protein S18 acetylase RimI-like enzyme